MSHTPFRISRRGLVAGAAGLTTLGALGGLAGCSSSKNESNGGSGASVALPERLSSRREVIISMDPSTVKTPFDPVLGFGETGVLPFHSALMKADENNQIVNDLATGYTISDDKLTWTFTIRDDVTFTNGAPLTAQDVAFTYNEAIRAAKVIIPNLKQAVATDDHTVELHLSAPSSVLLYTAAVLGIVPEAAYTSDYGDKPVGSGPWKFADYIQGQQLILERNDNYHGEKAKFAKATLLLMEPDAALAAAKSGQVDLACVYPALSKQNVAGFTLTSLPTFGYRTISLPCQQPGAWEVEGQAVGNAVTSDPALRKAMATAVNRQQIIDECLLGYGEVAFDFFDAFEWGIKTETAALTDGDVEGGKRILDEAGWVPGSDGIRSKGDLKASFTVFYPPNDSGRQAIAESFRAQMQALGIDVQLEGIDFTSMQDRNRQQGVVLGGGRLTPYHEYTCLSETKAKAKGWLNIPCYSNPTVEAHLEEALAATTQEEAYAAWHKALWDGTTGGSILGENPYLVIGYIRHNYFVRQGLDIGTQHAHPHDHFLHVIHNLNTWDIKA